MSFSELLFLGVPALVVFGPKKLAAIAQEIGKPLVA
jgi:Sec-independent protein translocase protein TatA